MSSEDSEDQDQLVNDALEGVLTPTNAPFEVCVGRRRKAYFHAQRLVMAGYQMVPAATISRELSAAVLSTGPGNKNRGSQTVVRSLRTCPYASLGSKRTKHAHGGLLTINTATVYQHCCCLYSLVAAYI